MKDSKCTDGVSKGTILRLGIGMRNHVLLLATLKDKRSTQKKQKLVMEYRSIGSPAQSTSE